MKSKKLKEDICDALDDKPKKLIQEFINDEKYDCTCPYCDFNFGIIEDPAYAFDRIHGTECHICNKEFEVEDKVRNGNKK